MRIALVSTVWNIVGGIETFGSTMYNGLKSKGHDVHLYLLKPRGGISSKLLQYDYLEALPEAKAQELLGDFDVVHWLRAGLENEKKIEKVSHTHLFDLGIPSVLTVHSAGETEWCRLTYTQENLSKFSSIVFTRDATRKYWQSKFQLNQVQTIPLPIDLSDAGRYEENKTESLVVTASRISWEKRLAKLVAASGGIKGKVAIYGNTDGFCGFNLKHMPAPSNLEFREAYNHKEIPKIFQPAKVIVDLCKSLEQGGGMEYVVIEAAKYGVAPVVSQNWIGEDFVSGKNAIAVPEDRFDHLHEYVNFLLEDESTRYEIVSRNLELIKKHDVESVISGYEKLYASE